MVDVTWLRWEWYRDKQMRDEEDNPDDCIPYVVCECPERGSEEN